MKFEISTRIKATVAEVYNSWLDSDSHSSMTGGKALVSNKEGDSFTAWDGYIQGKNVRLEPGKRIVQTWRTTEFNDEEEDSMIEITLKDQGGSTEISLVHSNLPEHGEQYKNGWKDHYFEPMKEYFENK